MKLFIPTCLDWGWQNHCVSACGGHVKFRTQGRNIVIASRDKKHSVMDLIRAERDMKHPKQRISELFVGHPFVFNSEICGVYSSLDVVFIYDTSINGFKVRSGKEHCYC
jgi:hypothetical protein